MAPSDKEIVNGPKESVLSYEPGMRVRDRRKGIATPQEFGIIKNIKDNIMTISWHGTDKKKEREEKIDMIEDTIRLHLIVAEV
jgi:hypothetical protein